MAVGVEVVVRVPVSRVVAVDVGVYVLVGIAVGVEVAVGVSVARVVAVSVVVRVLVDDNVGPSDGVTVEVADGVAGGATADLPPESPPQPTISRLALAAMMSVLAAI